MRKGASMPGIDPQFIIATVLERRNGIDLISKAWDRKTHFAEPDNLNVAPEAENRVAMPSDDEPDVIWDSVHPEPGTPDRVIPMKNKDKHRKTIVSNRVQMVDPNTNTRVRLESALEAGAMMIFLADREVTAIRPQYGPVWFMREGVWHEHYFDLCVDFKSGRRGLYAVRNEKHSGEVAADLELIRNHDLHNHAHYAALWSEREISQPAVYRASEIVRARRLNNEGDTQMVWAALVKAGGFARVYDVVSNLDGVTVARGWNAVWVLIGRGLVTHHHPQSRSVNLEFHSWIRAEMKVAA